MASRLSRSFGGVSSLMGDTSLAISTELDRKLVLIERRIDHHYALPRISRRAFGTRGAPFGLLLLLVAACQTTGGVRSRADANAFETAAQQAQECRAEIARKPEYQILRSHMPLADIEQADLGQMADARLISPPEVTALADWSYDLQQCRSEAVTVVERSGLSSYVPIVLADRDRQDRIIVLLMQQKITWGEAVLRLKASRTTLLAGISEETERRGSELSRSAEAERANRAALLNAFTRLVP
jgi:hypothetical protein